MAWLLQFWDQVLFIFLTSIKTVWDPFGRSDDSVLFFSVTIYLDGGSHVTGFLPLGFQFIHPACLQHGFPFHSQMLQALP